MKHIISLLLIISLANNVQAQSTTNIWETYATVPIEGPVSALLVDGNTICAGGYSSMESNVRSTDGGFTWSYMTFPGTVPAEGSGVKSFVKSGNNYFAAVLGHGIYKSVNQGASWQLLPTQPNSSFFIGPLLQDGSYLYYFGVDTVYVSTDEGATWQSIWCQFDYDANNICQYPVYRLINGTLFIKGDATNIYRSTDHGNSWQMINFTNHLYDITNIGNTLFALGNQNSIYQSIDNGSTWNMVYQFPSGSTRDIESLGNRLFVNVNLENSTLAGGIYYSDNLGLSWVKCLDNIYFHPEGHEKDITIAGDKIYVDVSPWPAVNSMTVLYVSEDYGNTWKELQTELDMACVTDLTKYQNYVVACAAPTGTMFVSTSNGEKWSRRGLLDFEEVAIIGSSGQLQYIIASKGSNIYRSADLGYTWDTIPNAVPAGFLIYEIYVNYYTGSQPHIYTLSEAGVFKSENMGENWLSCNNGYSANNDLPMSMCFVPNNNGGSDVYLVGYNGNLYKSTDAGNSWAIVPSINGVDYHYAFRNSNNEIIHLASSFDNSNINKIYRSTDDGNTWNILSGPDIYYPSHFRHLNGTTFAVFAGTIYVSIDDGLTWQPTNETCSSGEYLKSFEIHEDKILLSGTSPTYSSCELYGLLPNIYQYGMNVTGEVRFSTDNNCMPNPVDEPQKFIPVRLMQSGTVSEIVFTGPNGNFQFAVPEGNYTLNIDTNNSAFDVICPANNEYSFSLSPADMFSYNNPFKVKCKEWTDFAVQGAYTFGSFFQPGQVVNIRVIAGELYQLLYERNCNPNNAGFTLKVFMEGPVQYLEPYIMALTPDVFNDTLIYTITDANNLNYQNAFRFKAIIDSNAQVFDIVKIHAWVIPDSTDYYTFNNYEMSSFFVLNSFDPNMKEVSPVQVTQPGQWLTYTIHFQNTGTAPAINVKIIDTLSSLLFWETLQLLEATHNVNTHISSDGIVTFRFNNIILSDSASNPDGSKGHVMFRIKTKPEFVAPMTLSNSASIYFDYNDPIKTNYAVVTYPTISGTPFVANTLLLYPNPAADEVIINSDNFTSDIMVRDINGVVLIQMQSNKRQTRLNTNSLSNGTYFVELISGTEIKRAKLFIAR